MRAVFRFSECGAARWISHLDLMRAMARAVRRAGLPAKYTQGFHPHVAMSFAQALGVGYFSLGEYMELELDDSAGLEDAAKALNAALPGGIEITGAWRLDGKAPTLMAAVAASRWRVEFEEPPDEALLRKFRALLDLETIEVVKEGRNGPTNVDIRPGLYSIEKIIPPIACGHPPFVRGEGDCGNILRSTNAQERNSPYEGEMRGDCIELLLAAGSRLNIRPELVVKAALGGAGAVKAFTRMELYAMVNERLTPLYEICTDGDFYGR
jgi:radical SAM-linked protein